MKPDNTNQLALITVTLHWLIGLVMIGLLTVGVYMVETKTYSLYSWHKAIGFLIFFIIVLRVAWRIKNGWPKPVRQYKHFEHTTARIVHWILILGSVMMPISGFLLSSFAGKGVSVFGLEVVPVNVDPDNVRKTIEHSKEATSLFRFLHHWVGYIIIGSLMLHISASLKHHFIDKDSTLRRMLGVKI